MIWPPSWPLYYGSWQISPKVLIDKHCVMHSKYCISLQTSSVLIDHTTRLVCPEEMISIGTCMWTTLVDSLTGDRNTRFRELTWLLGWTELPSFFHEHQCSSAFSHNFELWIRAFSAIHLWLKPCRTVYCVDLRSKHLRAGRKATSRHQHGGIRVWSERIRKH